MTEKRKYRIAAAGAYAGLNASYISRVCGVTERVARLRLAAFYSHPNFAGKESEPAVLGRFIWSMITETQTRQTRTALNSMSKQVGKILPRR